MIQISLISLQSELSAQDPALAKEREEFLASCSNGGKLAFIAPKEGTLTMFFVQTGGSEIYFKKCYEQYPGPYYLLVHGERNSLAAALEILSFLHIQGKEGKIILGNTDKGKAELFDLARAFEAKKELSGKRIGVIGTPSDWLISSNVDYQKAKEKYGVEFIDISMEEFLNLVDEHEIIDRFEYDAHLGKGAPIKDLQESFWIHSALKKIKDKYQLSALTLRCFSLLESLKQTSCLAFALLNRDGFICGCEGDEASVLTMLVLKTLTGENVFMANPSRIDIDNKEAVFAHCTCPLDLFSSYRLHTHFESGIGIGIKGEFEEKEITAAKIAPDLHDIRALGGAITHNLSESFLCRSQINVKFRDDISCLLSDPFGNHMLFIYGDHVSLIRAFANL